MIHALTAETVRNAVQAESQQDHPNARLSDAFATNSSVEQAMLRGQAFFLRSQKPDGHWVGELEGDTILESEYLLLLAFLGKHNTPLGHKCGRYLLEKQLPTGGWGQYPGAKLDISASVKGYFTLKLLGYSADMEPLARARKAILAAGGADAVNSFTRYYLAIMGQIPYAQCPAVPPEIALLPNWFPVNLYSVSSWSRTIIVPLSIVWAHRPCVQTAAEYGISELFLTPPETWPLPRCPGMPASNALFSWERFFRWIDSTIKTSERLNLLPRQAAIAKCKDWMLERFQGSDGLGAIFPPMIWSVIALRCLGYSDDSPELGYCYERLDGLLIEDEHTARLQPCKSPVWDTAIALRALTASGLSSENPAMQKASHWLLSQEVTRKGDWAAKAHCPPGGWCFEYANEFYPDLDDTAMVAMALDELYPVQAKGAPSSQNIMAFTASSTEQAKAKLLTREKTRDAVQRGMAWMLGMQNKDGGWGAFDKDNNASFLCHVPFADHNAMIDPSTPDLSARVLEALGGLGLGLEHLAVKRCVHYLRATQEEDGAWFGRWGVNYVYGVWQVIVGLRAVGIPHTDPAIQQGLHWLIRHAHPQGGWGESADSYENPSLRGQGAVTASQTAWGLMGMSAAGAAKHPAAINAVRWLLKNQNEAGSWDESEFTGTGFPLVFYLRYHLYPAYFPLMALGKWSAAIRDR